MADVEQRIAQFFVSILGEERGALAQNSSNLFADGFLDSFGIVELASYLEVEFSFEIPLEDLEADRFVSVEAIAQLVQELCG